MTSPTAWVEQGSGEPLVFLHGLGGTSGSWAPQLAHFGPTRRCLAWDMPGYGDSLPEDPLTYESIARRFVEFLDDAGVASADVVGLSFGGMHALHVALRYPERIRSLVLANTSPAFGMDGTDVDEWKRARLDSLDRGATPADLAPAILDAIAGRPLEPSIRAELIEAFGRISGDGLRSAVHCLPHNDVRADLHRITQPALVIAGELDEETPVAYSQVLADGLPNAELIVLAGVGHLSPSEDPDLFNATVARFLAP